MYFVDFFIFLFNPVVSSVVYFNKCLIIIIVYVQVKASLFASGCFCELSEDFACVVLEMLIDLEQSNF